MQEIERTQRAVYFQLRVIFYTLGVMYKAACMGLKRAVKQKLRVDFSGITCSW